MNISTPPPPASDVSYVGGAQVSTGSANPQVTVPGNVTIGDRLILVGNYGNSPASPATPAGWTLVDSKVASGMDSYVWTKQATASDANSVVTTAMAASQKATLSVVAYRGVAGTGAIAAIASATDTSATQHTSPTVTAPAGGWVLQAWGDKSSATTGWTAPGGVTVRGTSYGSGTGWTTALIGDSGGPVAAGTYGGQVATTNSSSGRAIEWTIALAPRVAGSNPAPTAAFTANCSELVCTVDGSGSSDAGGSVATYAWDFGDGGTATGATPAAHTYATAGHYTITLTVTDNEGATNTTTKAVDVAPTPPPASNLGYAGTTQVSSSATAVTASVSVPAAVTAGDQLLLFGTYAITGTTSVTPTAPAGWSLVDSNLANGLESVVWTKTAGAGDAGTPVATTTSSAVKSTLTLAGYHGVATGGVALFKRTADAGTSHTTPPGQCACRRLGGPVLERQVIGDDGLDGPQRGRGARNVVRRPDGPHLGTDRRLRGPGHGWKCRRPGGDDRRVVGSRHRVDGSPDTGAVGPLRASSRASTTSPADLAGDVVLRISRRFLVRTKSASNTP